MIFWNCRSVQHCGEALNIGFGSGFCPGKFLQASFLHNSTSLTLKSILLNGNMIYESVLIYMYLLWCSGIICWTTFTQRYGGLAADWEATGMRISTSKSLQRTSGLSMSSREWVLTLSEGVQVSRGVGRERGVYGAGDWSSSSGFSPADHWEKARGRSSLSTGHSPFLPPPIVMKDGSWPKEQDSSGGWLGWEVQSFMRDLE